ncbi:unnamed protein product [Allacma fusca]|uniref:Uncharacterized protein n=1 Tax=Allacma fusca TaxID=39272 RepID=A0A8J2JXG6_9HEXA|nr:unnamed protein product [Allacma fusca]
MSNYSTLPYGNNVGVTPPPRERHHSTSSNNSAYGTITKATSGRLNYLANNYDSGVSTCAYEEDPEWAYPPRNLILANNLHQNSNSPAPSDHGTFTSSVSLNHSNIPPHAIYVQNTNTVAISRQSPYNNGSLLRRSPNPSAQYVTQSNLQQNVVKQLQEKFSGDVVLNNAGEINNVPNILSGDVELTLNDQASLTRRLKNDNNVLGGQNNFSVPDNNGGFSPLSMDPPGLGYNNSGKSDSNLYGVSGQLREGRSVNFGDNLDNDADSRGGTYLKSAWIHCRLPLLILIVVVLLVLFLSFSGALIYFKCKFSKSDKFEKYPLIFEPNQSKRPENLGLNAFFQKFKQMSLKYFPKT